MDLTRVLFFCLTLYECEWTPLRPRVPSCSDKIIWLLVGFNHNRTHFLMMSKPQQTQWRTNPQTIRNFCSAFLTKKSSFYSLSDHEFGNFWTHSPKDFQIPKQLTVPRSDSSVSVTEFGETWTLTIVRSFRARSIRRRAALWQFLSFACLTSRFFGWLFHVWLSFIGRQSKS